MSESDQLIDTMTANSNEVNTCPCQHYSCEEIAASQTREDVAKVINELLPKMLSGAVTDIRQGEAGIIREVKNTIVAINTLTDMVKELLNRVQNIENNTRMKRQVVMLTEQTKDNAAANLFEKKVGPATFDEL
jgi:hypothetical protein